jgi:hypothetical protein
MSDTNERFADLLTKAASLSSQAADLARRGKVEKALELERQADEFRAQARSDQAAKQTNAPKRSRTRLKGELPLRGEGGESTRSLTITSLVEIGVPASPRGVAEYAVVRFGKIIDHRALASLRRDELRAWSSPKSTRAVYVVPALEGTRFFPSRGKVALSDWTLGRRLIGPWSERVDHLVATRNLARQVGWLYGADRRAGEALSRLVAAYASTVAGALDASGKVDPGQVERAVEAELRVIGPRDEEWRAEAAERAAKVLKEDEQLWGTRAPGLMTDTSA